MRYTNAPELCAHRTLFEARDVRHAPLESLCEVEFGVVVNAALEAAAGLLGEVVVAVEEGCCGEDAFEAGGEGEGLVRMGGWYDGC